MTSATYSKQGGARPGRGGMDRPDMSNLSRAIRSLGKHWKLALPAYIALIISTVAQLAIPQFVQNIIDAITSGVVAQQIAALPEAAQGPAIEAAGWTQAQFTLYTDGATRAILTAGFLIVVFAVVRGVFAFVQSYVAERVSQKVAFDFRNELFAKIQTLSFSYHDRNQTGQLMIRATDDVEKVRHVHRPGVAAGAAGARPAGRARWSSCFLTNVRLTLVILPILPIAFVIFMIFGRLTQPLFMEVQIRLSALNTHPAGEPGRDQGGQGVRARAASSRRGSTLPQTT